MIKALTAIVLVGFLLRTAVLVLTEPTPLRSEEAIFAQRAIAWDRLQPLPYDADRAPGMTWFLRLIVLGFGDSLRTLHWGNVVLGTLIIPLAYFWSSRIVDRKTALAIALLAAIHLELVFYSASLYSEMLYVLVVYFAFTIFWMLPQRLTVASTGVLGILVGLATLTREIGIFLVPLLVFEIWRRSRSSFRRSLLLSTAFLVAFFLVLLPRTVQMSRRAGHFVLYSGMNERRLFNGTIKIRPGDDTVRFLFTRQVEGFNAYQDLSKDPTERRVMARKMALASIVERLPWWPLEKVATEIPILFEPVSFPARRLQAPSDDADKKGVWAFRLSKPSLDQPAFRTTLAAAMVAIQIPVSILGIIGLTLLRSGRILWPIGLVAITQIAPTLATTADDRYRVPILPLLLLGTAVALLQGRRLWREARPLRRSIAAAAVVLMVIALAA